MNRSRIHSEIFSNCDTKTSGIAMKIETGMRLSADEALFVYHGFSLGLIGYFALRLKEKRWGKQVFYNRNLHIELSNVCENSCSFCSFRRQLGDAEAWELGKAEVMDRIAERYASGITEVHVVGALNPRYSLDFYVDLFRTIRLRWPELHIKAFTAVEIEYIARNAAITTAACIAILRDAGMGSVPGGGAEIFADGIRQKLCPEKTSAESWLRIHREIHDAGLKSNCTMLYGHIETAEDRIKHLIALRNLQDETGGFNCFIPLKYKKASNILNLISEVPQHEDLRMIALSRLILDNIGHIKAYWPMLGKNTALLCLHFGADDFDGTISNSTRIYSMAGAEEQHPDYTAEELKAAVSHEGFIAVERDSLFNVL